MLSQLQKQLLNDFQKEFPLSPTPYKEIAHSLGVSEEDVLELLTELNQAQFISRIGPIISPNRIGVSTLVAMAIPTEQLQHVAEIVNQYVEVNHNYERESHYNLWFVLIAKDKAHLLSVIDKIEMESGYTAMNLPLLADYYINLGFEIDFDD
jgi:DNA-binding Lrp family transcriptional regulator